jgi:CubicO group peptidase (beta-lactamase class C family)
MRAIHAFAALIVLCTSVGAAQTRSSAWSTGSALFVDSVIRAEMQAQRIPGAAFVFVEDGRVAYQKGYGSADVERKTPVDPATTIWRIGSVSKTFTATAVMQLVDRRQVHLEADVNQYLKRVSVPGGYPLPVTLGDLLSHTGGLDEIRPGTQAEQLEGIQPLADFLRDHLVRVRAPGRAIAYSTYGITLAGLVIEDVSGSSYETFVARNIFQPLGMTRSSITRVPDSLAAAVARGYEWEDGKLVPQPWEWYHTTPASSINSTASDMAHYLIAHLQHGRYQDARLFSETTGRLMHQQRFTMHARTPGVGLGWFEETVGDLRLVEHGGNMAGYSSQLTMVPSEDSGFFLVSQLEGNTLRDILKDTLLKRLYPAARVRHPVPLPPPQWTDRAGVYAGRYIATTSCFSCKPVRSAATIEVRADSSGLFAMGKHWIETGPLLFVRDDGGRYLSFQADSAGRITGMSAGAFWTLDRLR